MSLQFTFNKPTFPIQNIVVCPLENDRGHRLGYNLVAQGLKPNQQAIITRFSADDSRQFIADQVAELKSELHIC